MCHYRHRAHPDPFRFVGLQDITAYVDFSAVADAAVAAGLDVLGYTTQAHFLIAAGLLRLAQDNGEDTALPLERAREIKLLTLPSEMGERFKAIGLGKGLQEKPSGFLLRDLADTL
jgi:SAM-dependent MidA family methyltransferase